MKILWRVWGLHPFPSCLSGTSVTCMGSSDTSLSRVRVSVTSNYVDTWIWWSGFILHLRNLVATLHELHINHFCYETWTRSSTSVCLLCSQLPRWLTSLLWLSLFWLLIADWSPPWSELISWLLIPYCSDLFMSLIWPCLNALRPEVGSWRTD
jgi:hypothetical protein